MIGAELQASVCADSVMTQHNVHDTKKLFDALVLTEVLPTLHQKGVVPLIVPADDQTLRATNGGHHLHLQETISHRVTEQPTQDAARLHS